MHAGSKQSRLIPATFQVGLIVVPGEIADMTGICAVEEHDEVVIVAQAGYKGNTFLICAEGYGVMRTWYIT